MSQEKLSNQSFRSRLADLDNLPGEDLQDKDAAWSRLHDRLREKPRRIKPLWYWAAAALIIACSLPFIITNRKPEGIVKEDAVKKIQQPVEADKSRSEEMPTVISTPGKAEQKPIKIINENNHVQIKDTGKNDNNTAAVVPPVVIPQQEIIPQLAAENIQIATTALPVKKKLRVVSINELYTPQESSMASSSLPPATVTKKFYNISTSTSPVQEYAGVLKIKISLKQ